MCADHPDGRLSKIRIGGKYDRARHALPRRPCQLRRYWLWSAGDLQRKHASAQLPARQDVAPDVPGVPAAALRQHRVGFREPGKSDSPASRYRCRAIPAIAANVTGGKSSLNRGSLISRSAKSTADSSSKASTTLAANSFPETVRTSNCSSVARSCCQPTACAAVSTSRPPIKYPDPPAYRFATVVSGPRSWSTSTARPGPVIRRFIRSPPVRASRKNCGRS